MKMSRFFFLLFLFALPVVSRLVAAPVDTVAARRVAAAFLRTSRGNALPGARLLAVGAVPVPRLVEHTESGYFFDDGAGGFVWAAADDTLPPVLGYGMRRGGELPSPLRLAVPCGRFTPRSVQPVAPMLTMVRHQNAPYNAACPRYRGDDGTLSEERCVVGCVATALEEIITHYRRPVLLRDTLHGWSTPHYDIPDVLPGTQVDTRLILDDYDRQPYTSDELDAVARLSYYCGVAVGMDWGLSSSGAHIRRLVDPLKRAFGFGTVAYVDSYLYEPDEWFSMMYREMQAGRPVLYTGYVMTGGGHAFVLDGVDEQGFFHVNWGYGGNYDGYFLLDVLNFAEPSYDRTPTGWETGFFCNQQALLLHPDVVDLHLPDTLLRTGTEVVVDSVHFELQPAAGTYTPLRLYLRNTSDFALTTPLALFTNTPADTSALDQGVSVANGGITLDAGERRMLRLHVLMPQAGSLWLRATPDDEHVILDTLVNVGPYYTSNIRFGEPAFVFPDTTSVHVSLPVTNAMQQGRSGFRVVYCLFEGPQTGSDGDTRHIHYVYLAAGESACDTVSFRGLCPGAVYTLLVRSPWTPIMERNFIVPRTTGIASPVMPLPAEVWYGTDGRRMDHPDRPGVYLRRRGGRVEKIYWNNKWP